MSRIRGTDTVPERELRSTLHQMGYRFRLHVRRLSGSPDVVLPKHRTVIFVHGCYWHRHKGCRFAYTPKTRQAFWQQKFLANVSRDRRVRRQLRQAGWRVLTVWECELKSQAKRPALLRRLSRIRDMRPAGVRSLTS